MKIYLNSDKDANHHPLTDCLTYSVLGSSILHFLHIENTHKYQINVIPYVKNPFLLLHNMNDECSID